MEKGTPWSFEEYDYLYKNYPTMGAEAVAEQLGRSVNSVRTKAERLMLWEHVGFQPEEISLIKSYGKHLGTAMIFLMPNRTTHDIKGMLK